MFALEICSKFLTFLKNHLLYTNVLELILTIYNQTIINFIQKKLTEKFKRISVP